MNILFVLYLWTLPVAFILPHRDFHELSRFPFGISQAFDQPVSQAAY